MDNMGISMNMSCVCNDGKWSIGFHTEDSEGYDINIEVNDIDNVEDCFDIILDEVISALTEPEEEYNDWDDVEDIDDYITEILEENRALRERVEKLEEKLQPVEDKCKGEIPSEKINELNKTIERIQKMLNSDDFGKNIWSSLVLK